MRQVRHLLVERRLAPFDGKIDAYFAAHAALEIRRAFERRFAPLPPTPRAVEWRRGRAEVLVSEPCTARTWWIVIPGLLH